MKESLPSLERKGSHDSAIVLRIFRHGNKEKAMTAEDQARFDLLKSQGLEIDKDYWIKLNPEGRVQAFDASDASGDMSQSLAYGSPRIRSRETAMHVMDGTNTGPEMTYEETLAELDKDLKMGSKVGVDERLNFAAAGETGEAFNKAYERKETLKWLVEESDEMARANKDTVTSTYSRMAGNVASLVEKYFRASDRWEELVEDESKGYDKELNRFLGTHQTVTESFLAKVMEKTRGADFRNKFIDALGGMGFGFVEGATIRIENKDGEKKIMIEYSKDLSDGTKFEFNEEISPEIIREIIKESDLGIEQGQEERKAA